MHYYCCFGFSSNCRSNNRIISWCGVCGNISTAAASFNKNGSPLSVFEHGRAKSIQFFIAFFGEHATYMKRLSPFAFRMASFDRGSEKLKEKTNELICCKCNASATQYK